MMVKFLEKVVFLRFLVLKKILSDNGVQFKSKVYNELLEKYAIAITLLYSASYHGHNNLLYECYWEMINESGISTCQKFI
jgi:hypothetical protein